MTAPITVLRAKGKPAATAAVLPSYTLPALPSWIDMTMAGSHRWEAMAVPSNAGSEIQSAPDTVGAAGEPLVRQAPGVGNNPGDVGSPEPTPIFGPDGSVIALRLAGINLGASQQVSTAGRVFWTVFRQPVGFVTYRLGGCTFGRNANLSGRISLTAGKFLSGDVASRSAPVLVIAAWLDPTGVVASCNGTPMTGDTTYTASTQNAFYIPITTVDKGSGAVGSRTSDFASIGIGGTPQVGATRRAPTIDELNAFTSSMLTAPAYAALAA